MNHVLQFPSAASAESHTPGPRPEPALATDAVYVLFTSIDETRAALKVAAGFAAPLGVPVTLVHLRTVPYALPVDEPNGLSPVETSEFIEALRAEGADVRARIYLCRDERRALPSVLKRRSLVVLGGRRSWWPTPTERWRRMLEAAGHLVVFVDTARLKEPSHA